LELSDVPNPANLTFTANNSSTSKRAQQRSILNRRRAQVVTINEAVKPISQLSLTLSPLPPNCEFTKGRPSLWQVMDPEGILDWEGGQEIKREINLAPGGTTTIPLKALADGIVELETAVYFCQGDSGVCQTSGVVTRVPVSSSSAVSNLVVGHVVRLPEIKGNSFSTSAQQ